jgi:hypothetical protein
MFVPQVKQQWCHVCAAELLRRSEEKKDQRKKERLDAYYKKNFKVWQLNMPAVGLHLMAHLALVGMHILMLRTLYIGLIAEAGRTVLHSVAGCTSIDHRATTGPLQQCPVLSPLACCCPQEYFEFDSGTARAATARGISPETQQEIARWLEANK